MVVPPLQTRETPTLLFSHSPAHDHGFTIDSNTGLVRRATERRDAPSTSTFTVQVFDNGDPARSDQKAFTVAVRRDPAIPARPFWPQVLIQFLTSGNPTVATKCPASPPGKAQWQAQPFG